MLFCGDPLENLQLSYQAAQADSKGSGDSIALHMRVRRSMVGEVLYAVWISLAGRFSRRGRRLFGFSLHPKTKTS
jgi:hypothetical protein